MMKLTAAARIYHLLTMLSLGANVFVPPLRVAVVALWLLWPSVAGAVSVGGYMAPDLRLTLREGAREVDAAVVGFGESRAGLVVNGEVTSNWSYALDIRVGAQVVAALSEVRPLDRDGDGQTDDLLVHRRGSLGSIIEEATIAWQPLGGIRFWLGERRIPFTSQSRVHDTELLFANRSGPADAILKGRDLGGGVELRLFDGRLHASAGAFNGDDVLREMRVYRSRGLLYSARLDIAPLGEFKTCTSCRDLPRFEVGAGVAFHPYTSFDKAGAEDVRVQDLRVSISGQGTWAGVLAAGELLLRRQRDTLSSRPESALGAWGQLAWLSPLRIEPVARFGFMESDQSFDPRTTRWLSVGLNYHPVTNTSRELLVGFEYGRESRITEDATANTFALRTQLQW